MKTCNSCNAQNDDTAKFCVYCGSSDFASSDPVPQEPVQQFTNNPYTYQQPAVVKAPEKGNGNIIAGAVGAFLFSIIGGLLYFLIYQAGIIAGVCGLVIFVLANFGYNLFAKSGKNSVAGLIVSIIMLILMTFIAEYVCVSFEIYQAFKEEGVTFFECVRATPDFLEAPEIKSAFIKDFAFALIFGLAASVGSIANIIKARKNSK